ncbi:MAG: Ku protein, partial [Acidobacteriota bacterium]|nr:Ku protein [Acidobacteriota bacterium]
LETVPEKVKPEELKLARQVIETFEQETLNLADYRDEYQQGLLKIIEAKVAGEEIVAPAVEEPAKVVNLMDALRKSLDAVSASKKTPAKAAMRTAAARPAAKGKRKRA